MQFIVPTALALALPAGIVAHDLAPLRDVALAISLVALLSLCIARAAEAEEERRFQRRLFALTHRLWRSWIRRPL